MGRGKKVRGKGLSAAESSLNKNDSNEASAPGSIEESNIGTSSTIDSINTDQIKPQAPRTLEENVSTITSLRDIR